MTATAELTRVLRGADTISEEVYEIVEGPDRKGNYLLRCGQKNVLAHPSRMLRINEGCPAVYRTDTELKVACPCCSAGITVEIGAETATCTCDESEGEFTIDWSKVESCVRPAPPEDKTKPKPKSKAARAPKVRSQKQPRKSKEPVAIDFEALKKIGEVWTKDGVKFDYVEYSVQSHTIIIWGSKPRKMSFNSYNGAWGGKKSGEDKLQAFIDNTPRAGKSDWYVVKKTPDQERKKLERDGYTQM